MLLAVMAIYKYVVMISLECLFIHKISNSKIEESTYCTDIMKKHFNIEFVVNKKDDENFKKCPKHWICYDVYDDSDLNVRNHCNRGSA